MSTVAFRLISTTHPHPVNVDLAAARQEFLIDGLVILQHAVLTPSELDTIVGGAAGRATTSISHVGAAYRVELQGGRYLDANAGDIIISNHIRIRNDLISRPSVPTSPVPPQRQLRPPKTWYCPIQGCNSSFNRSDNLRRHLKDGTRGPQHIQYAARQPDAPIIAPNRVNTAVERLTVRYPSVALVPDARGFEEVADVEDRFSAVCRNVHAVLAREFPEFNLWAEVRFGGNRIGDDATAAPATASTSGGSARGAKS